ncbi:MAG: hypothetical protein LBB88_10945 [Planctomycetaceae bacterium]|nr:hypothetical protein [Planctomycetaceae bacterium]
MNPILVKETRQFVRSKFIVVLTNLYICSISLIFLFVLFFTTNTNDLIDSHHSFTAEGSRVISSIFVMMIFWTCFFTVIMRTAWTTANDRINEDLMFYSSIKPSTIVFGKLISGVIITLIIMSVTAPFITLAYSMGGIDLTDILIRFVFVFLNIQILNSLAILVAATSKIRFAPFLSLVVITILFLVFNSFIVEAFREWNNMERNQMLLEFAGFLLASISACALFISVAVAKLSPQNSNRLFPMRIIVTIIFIAAIFVTLYELFLSPLVDVLENAESACLLSLLLFLLLVVCERDRWTSRIRRRLPKSLVMRSILFPFYTGSPSGLVWVAIMFAVLVIIDFTILLPLSVGTRAGNMSRNLFGEFTSSECTKVMPACIFFFNYCITAMLIRSWFLKKLDSSRTWLVIICLIVFVSSCSVFVFFIYNFVLGALIDEKNILDFLDGINWFDGYRNSWLSSIDLIQLLDIPAFINSGLEINQIELSVPMYRVYVAFGWTIIILPFLIIWYYQRLKEFSPNNIKETISYDDAVGEIRNAELS